MGDSGTLFVLLSAKLKWIYDRKAGENDSVDQIRKSLISRE